MNGLTNNFFYNNYNKMKKQLTILALFIAMLTTVKAQNVQTMYDFGEGRQHATTTLEMFKTDDWGSTFFFADFEHSGPQGEVNLAYVEIARAINLGKLPFQAHIEYNGGTLNTMQISNSYLLGIEKTWLAKDFSKGLTLIGAYKNITNNTERNNFQVTAVWFMKMMDGKLTFNGFADFWKEKHTVSNDGFKTDFQDSEYIFLSEPQLWYNATKHLSLGGELELSYDFGGQPGFFARPALGAKWTF